MSYFKDWIKVLNPGQQTRVRLICFPYAGGGAFSFKPWGQHLPQWIELCAIQYPGRENRIIEPPLRKAADFANHIAQAIIDWAPETPIAFFGHSFGALLSYETTHILKQTRFKLPIQLFISARRAPQTTPDRAPISALSRADLLAELKEMNGTPSEVLEHEELMSLLLPMMRADFHADENYIFSERQPLNSRFTLLGGKNDPYVPRKKLNAWSALTTGMVKTQLFPGDHFYINDLRPDFFHTLTNEIINSL